ncbi:MAG: hypothetical protein CVV42_20215 [Candidatus Riflebacteria bacterium HGW-Riflebacteria-2]|jgi:hypothetical protein|nr:MAG: hypothetical protein CVV42_20215 [Candidatus Riflebacteria bacterium HGW-Riflebacteria-2]
MTTKNRPRHIQSLSGSRSTRPLKTAATNLVTNQAYLALLNLKNLCYLRHLRMAFLFSASAALREIRRSTTTTITTNPK